MCGHCFTVCYVAYVLMSVVIQPSWLPNPIKVIIIITTIASHRVTSGDAKTIMLLLVEI